MVLAEGDDAPGRSSLGDVITMPCAIIASDAREDTGCIFSPVTSGTVVFRSLFWRGLPLQLHDTKGPTKGHAIDAIVTMAALMGRLWMGSGPAQVTLDHSTASWGALVPCLPRPRGSAWIYLARMGSSLASAWHHPGGYKSAIF